MNHDLSNFAERLELDLASIRFERQISHRFSEPDKLFVTYVNLPHGEGGGGGGADAMNNRILFSVCLAGEDAKGAPKVRVEQMSSAFPREVKLRSKTGQVRAVAEYLADFLKKIARDFEPYNARSQAGFHPNHPMHVKGPHKFSRDPDHVTCKACKASIDPLAVFPGGICVACHSKRFDAQVKRNGGVLPRPDFAAAVKRGAKRDPQHPPVRKDWAAMSADAKARGMRLVISRGRIREVVDLNAKRDPKSYNNRKIKGGPTAEENLLGETEDSFASKLVYREHVRAYLAGFYGSEARARELVHGKYASYVAHGYTEHSKPSETYHAIIKSEDRAREGAPKKKSFVARLFGRDPSHLAKGPRLTPSGTPMRHLVKFPCDFLVNTHGHADVFVPTTPKAKRYAKKLGPAQWVAGAKHTGHKTRIKGFVVAHAHAAGLANDLRKRGFEVHHA